MMRRTQVFREMLTAGCVFAATATGCFALAACGGEAKVSEPEQTVAQTTQATPTAQAQENQLAMVPGGSFLVAICPAWWQMVCKC
jgi:hypothetical protein